MWLFAAELWGDVRQFHAHTMSFAKCRSRSPPPTTSIHSLSFCLSLTHTHGCDDISAADTKVCPLAPAHVLPLHMQSHGPSHRVGWCNMRWQHFQLFGINWCSCFSQDALFISRQVLPPHPPSHLLYQQPFE